MVFRASTNDTICTCPKSVVAQLVLVMPASVEFQVFSCVALYLLFLFREENEPYILSKSIIVQFLDIPVFAAATARKPDQHDAFLG